MAIHALNKVAYKTGTPTSIWKAGQLVWLKEKNLPLPYGTAKLAPRHHGPFKIIKNVSPVVVQLELPAQWSIHPVFHTSLIMAYTETPSHGPNFTRPPPDLIDGEAEYEVEQICSHRTWGRHKVLQYLIKWKGYPESDNTWENANQIHTPILIKLYHQNAAQRTIKARWIHLKQHQFPSSIPFRHSIAHLCSLTTNPFFIATTAHSLPLDPIGFTTTSLSADTADSITALSAQEHSELEPTSKRTSSTSTRSTPQLDVESTKSNPSTHPMKTPFYYPIRHSYIDSNRWRRPFTPFIVPSNPNHACARPRCPASTLS
jgi:Chromo (CHRromatin Organisation MOdifier) domain